MLLHFTFRNLRSIRDEQSFSLVASSSDEMSEVLLPVVGSKMRALRCAAVYGANASGKSNFVKAFAYFGHLIRDSHNKFEPGAGIETDMFGQSLDESSRFEVDFVLEGVLFNYGTELNHEEILEEWLVAYPNGRAQEWFRRSPKNAFKFSRTLGGNLRTIESLTRSNSLFLSSAAQNKHERLTVVFDFFIKKWKWLSSRNRGNLRSSFFEMCEIDSSMKRIKSLLQRADLGIVDFNVEEKDVPEELKSLLETMNKQFPKTSDVNVIPEKLKVVSLLHQGPDDTQFKLQNEEESDGTMSYLSLLGPIMAAIDTGSLLVIDELEASLHSSLARHLVQLFNSHETNPKGAQLVFTTHDTSLLEPPLLRRDQVWFTEKDKNGCTSLYPLSDFKTRREENPRRGYLQGRYGAIPFLNATKLVMEDSVSNV